MPRRDAREFVRATAIDAARNGPRAGTSAHTRWASRAMGQGVVHHRGRGPLDVLKRSQSRRIQMTGLSHEVPPPQSATRSFRNRNSPGSTGDSPVSSGSAAISGKPVDGDGLHAESLARSWFGEHP